ncbi:hypothetical protein VC83_03402 [Pseudogymnoascus destructans]|uniref:Uncharacterized protein n=1 Tax=Pseudogymnoascus destructans TaxID=655981 RepID=A0A177AHJ1_9PEZI|nr:uncharacterized protein VC83_03402 [Pseudogymnoascus destructans]OAF60644.1 hypothetical protein VC83_03402 [Pseudogymnoascus destructans]
MSQFAVDKISKQINNHLSPKMHKHIVICLASQLGDFNSSASRISSSNQNPSHSFQPTTNLPHSTPQNSRSHPIPNNPPHHQPTGTIILSTKQPKSRRLRPVRG